MVFKLKLNWTAREKVFFVALAADYDGTLALDGKIDAATIEALKNIKASGRKLIMVTGRELSDLRRVFSAFDLFDLIVAENGALLFNPAKNEEMLLTEPPSQLLVERLNELGVAPLSVGRTIIATWEPHETTVLEAIRELGLELHIIFNKGAVMVLPGDINKASGLKHALRQLGLSPHNVVGIGDAENDLAFLSLCGMAAAVDNALPSVKRKADLLVAHHGAGVIELAHMLTETDLCSPKLRAPRALPILGTDDDGRPLCLSPFESVLVTGSSGAGKSTIVTALLENMRELSFQFCVVDPEGDYAELADTVVVGDAKQEPRLRDVMRLLGKPDVSVVVNLLAVEPEERPRFLTKLLPEIAKLRGETGRPHWLVLDEAHHCMPAKSESHPMIPPEELPATIAVTVHPDEVARDFLGTVAKVVSVGDRSLSALAKFCKATQRPCPDARLPSLATGQVHVLDRTGTLDVLTTRKPKERQKRHARKYAEGDLGTERSFYFRGPDRALNLRAQNLSTFVQLASGVDDKTWLHHLRAGEYSSWFHDAIKDEDLAAQVRLVEQDGSLSPLDSRARIKALVEQRYTAPARE